MRIVSGKYKGRHFKPPKDFKARPTTDFAKENLFNILANYIDFQDKNVLDLFAGTGSIGIEFISRGASRVTSVENNYKHFQFLKKITQKLDIDNIRIIKKDVFRFLEHSNEKFDLIFADPPYQLEGIDKLPDLIFNNNLIEEKGILIIEHSSQTHFGNHNCFSELRTYGSVNFSFFRPHNL